MHDLIAIVDKHHESAWLLKRAQPYFAEIKKYQNWLINTGS
jgi:hypothetical protein